jgi:hypothetical protein
MALRSHPADQVIAAYIKVLGELADMKAKRAPEHVLPLPKEQMVTVLRASEHPKKEELLEALDYFFSKQFNAFFFFVVQYTKRRQFRRVS